MRIIAEIQGRTEKIKFIEDSGILWMEIEQRRGDKMRERISRAEMKRWLFANRVKVGVYDEKNVSH